MACGDTREALRQASVSALREGGTNTPVPTPFLSLPRSSFYHHFENKHQFIVAALQRWSEMGVQVFGPVLRNMSTPPLSRLRHYFAAMIQAYGQEGDLYGCRFAMMEQ
jgi:AcrR family transcriptional regulator